MFSTIFSVLGSLGRDLTIFTQQPSSHAFISRSGATGVDLYKGQIAGDMTESDARLKSNWPRKEYLRPPNAPQIYTKKNMKKKGELPAFFC